MKIAFAGILLIVLFSSFSFHPKKFIPPGTVKISDTLYADINEINNLSWMEYVFWTRMKYGKHSAEALATLPDTSVWLWDNMNSNAPYMHQYRLGAFKNYPVSGISHEQAQRYCKWRSERVREFYCISGRYEPFQFEYRLPSEEEWEFVSNNGGHVFGQTNEAKLVVNKTHQKVWKIDYKANCFINDSISSMRYSQPCATYPANYFGLHDVIGNVAEMVQQKGIAKGGSWKHPLDECRVGKKQFYSVPQAWLGFRCVCIVRPAPRP